MLCSPTVANDMEIDGAYSPDCDAFNKPTFGLTSALDRAHVGSKARATTDGNNGSADSTMYFAVRVIAHRWDLKHRTRESSEMVFFSDSCVDKDC
jgi:hypothetical protein